MIVINPTKDLGLDVYLVQITEAFGRSIEFISASRMDWSDDDDDDDAALLHRILTDAEWLEFLAWKREQAFEPCHDRGPEL